LAGQSRCHSVNGCENGFLNRRTLRLTWILKGIEICIELAFHSPPPTPLLPAPTLSAGEYKVSGRGGPQPTCSSLEAQNGLPLFLMAFSRLLSCRRGGATRFLLKVHGPLPLPGERVISVRSAGWACFARCVRSLRSPSSYYAVSSRLPPLWTKDIPFSRPHCQSQERHRTLMDLRPP
jgi:hypothetical protein